MKKITYLSLFLLIAFVISSFRYKESTSSKTTFLVQDDIKGSELFVSKGCALCHSPEKTILGPSLKDISKAYKGDVNKMLEFLDGKAKPIVNPKEFQYMKSVLVQLKKMKEEERKELATYYMSFYKD